MANVFDQFDEGTSASAPPAGNVFDQFDAPAAATATPEAPKRGFNLPSLGSVLSGVMAGAEGDGKALAKGTYDAIVGGVTLPRDVYQGKVDPLSDEGIRRSWDLATIASPMSVANRSALAVKGSEQALAPAVERVPALADDAAPAAASARDIVQASENVGVPVPRIALMPSLVQKFGAGLSDLPVIGAPLQNSAERSLARARESVGDIASTIGVPDAAGAGLGIKEGISNFKNKGMRELEERAYAPINEAMPKDPRFVPIESAMTLGNISQRLADSNGALSGEAKNIADLVLRGKVTFKGLQDARSRLGAEMANPLDAAGYNDGASRALYGALSKDLEGFVGEHGGESLLSKWASANAETAAAKEQFGRVKPLANVANENQAFETAYNLMSDRSGSYDKLFQLKKTVGADEWSNFGATALRRMGGEGDQFSIPKFVTAYDKMNPSARKMVFGETSKSVDDLATTFRALGQVERFKSKSQSANPTALLGMSSGSVGLFAAPVTTVLSGLTGYMVANQLAKPAAVKQLSTLAKSYEILLRRPSEGLARQVTQQSRRMGEILAADGAGGTADHFVRSLGEATRSIVGPVKGASASGDLQKQDQQQR